MDARLNNGAQHISYDLIITCENRRTLNTVSVNRIKFVGIPMETDCALRTRFLILLLIPVCMSNIDKDMRGR
jgi:hypothetical protein